MDDSSPGSIMRANSVRLMRASSATFTGGGHIPQHSQEQEEDTENTPIRNQSRRQAIRSQAELQQRMMQEVEDFLRSRLGCVICVGCTVFIALIAVGVLFFLAAIANISHFGEPCDKPLKWYLFISLMWSQVPQQLGQCVARCFSIEDPWKLFVMHFLLSLPAWLIIAWGVYMLASSSTCQKTNPGLFFPVRNYIIAQIVLMALLTVVTILLGLGFRRLLMLANMLSENPGCAKAVHKLPKVDEEASELIDIDGEVKSCIICLEALGKQGRLKRSVSILGAPTSAIVKTPCKHYFHEECLASWCKNHLDCPLCREQVGDPDPKEDGEAGANV